MKKLVDITKTVKISIDENHPEFEQYIKTYETKEWFDSRLSAIDKMIINAVKNNFSAELPIVQNGIIKLVTDEKSAEAITDISIIG